MTKTIFVCSPVLFSRFGFCTTLKPTLESLLQLPFFLEVSQPVATASPAVEIKVERKPPMTDASRDAAATLLTVALNNNPKQQKASAPTNGASTGAKTAKTSTTATSFTVRNKNDEVSATAMAPSNGSTSVHNREHLSYLATTTAPLASGTPPPSFPSHHQHPATHHAHLIPPPAVASNPAANSEQNTLLSMSSIGFGVDSSAAASWGDATESALKALQDAMERSTLRLPINSNGQSTSTSLQIQVQLGVPAKKVGSAEPMVVDVSRVTAILPRAIPVLPIRVVVGGLYLPGSPPVCTAVACITLQTEAAAMAATTVSDAPQLPTHPNTATPVAVHQSKPVAAKATPESWASLEVKHQPELAHPPPPLAPSSVPVAVVGTTAPGLPSGVSSSLVSAKDTASRVHIQGPPDAGRAHPIVAAAAAAAAAKPKAHQSSTSIEMLAIISEEMRLAGDKRSVSAPSLASSGHQFPPIAAKKPVVPTMLGPATTALQHPSSLEYHSAYDTAVSYLNGSAERPGSPMSAEEALLRGAGNYNYKKLPPGVTTKNNRRLFVKHIYRDYSGEHALPEEQDLIIAGGGTTSSARTPNAAFPLKLHETLSQIEANGHGDIIGWNPHGRAFKIRKQKEFAEIILPRYFVMTKKSSFLRQLNLYGFNRFSAGPDQGSYYHEKFLRGLKFLCRRMTRQKVNGNRIRSAGNPDDEPNLSLFPVCPPPNGITIATTPSASNSATSPIQSSPTVRKTQSPTKRNGYTGTEEDIAEAYDESSIPQDHKLDVDDHNEDISVDDSATTTSNPTAASETLALPARTSSGGSQVSFPLMLQRILDKLESERQVKVISWLSHGRAFVVLSPESFVDQIMSVYFDKIDDYSSFQEHLNLYNFQKLTTGRDKGAYYHTHFQRGKPHLCMRMVRGKVNGTVGARKPGNSNSEPNLYSLQPLPPIPAGAQVEVPSDHVDDERRTRV